MPHLQACERSSQAGEQTDADDDLLAQILTDDAAHDEQRAIGRAPGGEAGQDGPVVPASHFTFNTLMTSETVLLIHSGGFTSRQWRKLSDLLSPDFRVIAPNLLGYDTPWPDGKPFHFREDLAFLLSLIDEPMHFVGHSYGGFLALQLALARPDLVRSIAVYDPVAFGILDEVEDLDAREPLGRVRREWQPGSTGADEQWLAGFVDWWNGDGAWNRLPEATRASFRTLGWKVFQEVMSLTTDRTSRETYATITAPALIMGGSESPLPERRVVERLGATLPHATVTFFPAGHMGPVSHAATVNAAIAAHLTAPASKRNPSTRCRT